MDSSHRWGMARGSDDHRRRPHHQGHGAAQKFEMATKTRANVNLNDIRETKYRADMHTPGGKISGGSHDALIAASSAYRGGYASVK